MSILTRTEPMEVFHPIQRGVPVWDIALLFPEQGDWTEEEYLRLDTNRLIEFVDGCLEFLPMPTPLHQAIAQFLYETLKAWVVAHSLGEVFMAPLRVHLWEARFRQPDVVFLRPGRILDRRRPPRSADLVMEVLSEGKENRDRDLETKRIEYARAKIGEYWIVDPQERKITVLILDGETYRLHGEFTSGQQATSVLLPGFAVDVSAAFAAGEGPLPLK